MRTIARLEHEVPQLSAEPRGAVNLKAGLADESDAQHANGNGAEMAGAHRKVRERLGGKIDVAFQFLDHGPRLRAGYVDAGIGRGDIGDIDVEPPLLIPEAHQPIDLVDGAGLAVT